MLITVDDQITAGPARLECLDGDGARFSMPDFAQDGDGDGNLTSAELTAQLLEPEQAALDDMSARELAAEDEREIVTGEIDTTPVEPSENGASDE